MVYIYVNTMALVPWEYLHGDVPIVVLKHDGGCGGVYATMYMEANQDSRKTILTLPTKNTWTFLSVKTPRNREFRIIKLRLNWGIQEVYVIENGIDVDSAIPWKQYTGQHRGLGRYAKTIMEKLHSEYFCKDGFLGKRTEPPSNTTCMYLR
jgi:hypothetical protein